MFVLYQKRTCNLVMATLVLLLFFILNASSMSRMLALAQLSGEANNNVVDDALASSLAPLGQSSLDSSWTTNYSFPFEHSQQDSTLTFSDSQSSEMDFNMFMESFANSIFNGTSIFGGLGTSMVNGVKVSGIAMNDNGTLSVTLSGSPTEVSGGNSTCNIHNY